MVAGDYYGLLGVSRAASAAEIEEAFRARALALQEAAGAKSPQAMDDYRALVIAYRTLRGAEQRAAYDAQLPPAQVGAEEGCGLKSAHREEDLDALWKQAVQLFVARSERFSKAFDALHAAVPIAVDDDSEAVILGLAPASARLAGYLESGDAPARLRGVLREVFGRALTFRVVPATTPEAWQAMKEAERRIRERQAAVPRQVAAPEPSAPGPGPAPPASATWEDVTSDALRAWSKVEARRHPQQRARYLLRHLEELARAEEGARAAGMADADVQAGVARVLTRIASLVEMDVNVLALEYLRARARLLGGT